MHGNLHLFALFVFCAVIAVQKCTADRSWGSCPSIKPVPDLSINKLLGIWYVIQKTSVSGSCLIYNITKDTEQIGGHYLLTKIEQRSSLLLEDYEYQRTEKLTVPNTDEPGVMDVHVPFTIGTPKLTVVVTDHDHYLGIFTCKQYLGLVRSWSAVILSRTPTLNVEDVEFIRTRFSSYNVDPSSLSIVSQKDCASKDLDEQSDDEVITYNPELSDFED